MANTPLVQFSKNSPYSNGGVEYVVKKLHENQIQKGMPSYVVFFSKDNQSRECGVACKVDLELFSQKISLQYLKQAVSKSYNKKAVVFHLPNFMAILSAFIIKLMNKDVKIILFWHADIPVDSLSKGILSFILRPLEILSLRIANSVIYTSQRYFEHSYSRRYTKKNTVEIIPIGIDDFDYDLIKNSKTKRTRPFKILFVGRLVKYKNVKTIISAINRIPNVELDIVGEGPELDDLRQLVADLNCEHRVKINTKVSNQQLHDFYMSADLFILPSNTKAEAFGVVLLEAMKYGLPCITYDIPGSGVSSVNKHLASGLVLQDITPNSLANSIERLIRDENLLYELSVGSRERYLRHFTADKMVDAFLQVIDGR